MRMPPWRPSWQRSWPTRGLTKLTSRKNWGRSQVTVICHHWWVLIMYKPADVAVEIIQGISYLVILNMAQNYSFSGLLIGIFTIQDNMKVMTCRSIIAWLRLVTAPQSTSCRTWRRLWMRDCRPRRQSWCDYRSRSALVDTHTHARTHTHTHTWMQGPPSVCLGVCDHAL